MSVSTTTIGAFKELFDRAESPCISISGTCHDCKTAEVTINADWNLDTGEVIIEGDGAYYNIKAPSGSDMHFFKCKECYEKDEILRNYMPTEVYSRITGYLRPVGQWNPGKTAEFKMRQTYDMEKV